MPTSPEAASVVELQRRRRRQALTSQGSAPKVGASWMTTLSADEADAALAVPSMRRCSRIELPSRSVQRFFRSQRSRVNKEGFYSGLRPMPWVVD